LREEWLLNDLYQEISQILNIEFDIGQISDTNVMESDIINFIYQKSQDFLQQKQESLGRDNFFSAVKYVFLSVIDKGWKEHLHNLDHLRQGINFRAYGQKDPFNEYKNEAFVLFEQMLDTFSFNMVQTISHLHINQEASVDKLLEERQKSQKIQELRQSPELTKYDSSIMVETQLKSSIIVNKEDRDPNDPNTWGRVARNEFCPCGSEKKYKQCHGAL
jgi:preprotein translocase subunit SecA